MEEERVEDDAEAAPVAKLAAVKCEVFFPDIWLFSLLVSPEEPPAPFLSRFFTEGKLETFGEAVGGTLAREAEVEEER